MGTRILCLVAVCCFVLPLLVNAGELEEIVVVSTPIIEGNYVDRYASTTTVVSLDQIGDLNAQDLGTALRRTPGVNISRYNPIGSFGGAEGGAIFIRGMGSSRPGSEIKIFVDDIPMYMGVWNHPLLDLVSIDTASTIEVFKGPQPHQFGNAFSGINLVPKALREEGHRATLSLSGGSYSTISEKVEHGGKRGRFDYYIGQSLRSSEGHRELSEGRLANYFIRLGVGINKNWSSGFLGLHTDNYALDPGEINKESLTRNGRYETFANMGVLSLAHSYEVAEGSLKIYSNKGKGYWYDQITKSLTDTKDTLSQYSFKGIKFRENLRLWPKGEIILGVDRDEIDGNVTFVKANGTRTGWEAPDWKVFSPYMALSQAIGDEQGLHIIPSAGVRYYHHTKYRSETAPHLGLVLGYKDLKFHGGYSRGVLYPGLEVVVFSQAVNPALGSSWENLRPEILNHYELGVSYAWEKFQGDVTFFTDRGKDRYVILAPPPPPPMYINWGEYKTRGVELSFTYVPFKEVSLFTGITLLDSEPEDLPYAPDTTVSAGITYRFLNSFKLCLDSQYVSKMNVGSWARRKGTTNPLSVDSFLLFNGKLSWFFKTKLGGWHGTGEVFLSGENLTNTDYEYKPGYPMPGINGMIGLSLNF